MTNESVRESRGVKFDPVRWKYEVMRYFMRRANTGTPLVDLRKKKGAIKRRPTKIWGAIAF